VESLGDWAFSTQASNKPSLGAMQVE